jgi:hypothetical protein
MIGELGRLCWARGGRGTSVYDKVAGEEAAAGEILMPGIAAAT